MGTSGGVWPGRTGGREGALAGSRDQSPACVHQQQERRRQRASTLAWLPALTPRWCARKPRRRTDWNISPLGTEETSNALPLVIWEMEKPGTMRKTEGRRWRLGTTAIGSRQGRLRIFPPARRSGGQQRMASPGRFGVYPPEPHMFDRSHHLGPHSCQFRVLGPHSPCSPGRHDHSPGHPQRSLRCRRQARCSTVAWIHEIWHPPTMVIVTALA